MAALVSCVPIFAQSMKPTKRPILTATEGTGGLITPATVGEQLLYEIGDPGAYHVPEVATDLTRVSIAQEGPGRVRVADARGQPPTSTYKVAATVFPHRMHACENMR